MNKKKRNALLFGTVFVAGTAAVTADHVMHRGLDDPKPAGAHALTAGASPCAAAAPCAAGAATAPCAAGARVETPAPGEPAAAPPPRIAAQPAASVPGPRIAGQR